VILRIISSPKRKTRRRMTLNLRMKRKRRMTNEAIREDLMVKNEFLKISLIINVDTYLSNNG